MFKEHCNDFPGLASRGELRLPGLILLLDDEQTPEGENKNSFLLSSVLKKRRKKMNKHKYKKRIHRDKAKIKHVTYFRLRRKTRRQAHMKKMLTAKIKKVLKVNPKSDVSDRPYIIHRLKNW